MPQLYDMTSECVRNDHHETGGWRIIYLFCGNEVAVTIGCQTELVIPYLNIYIYRLRQQKWPITFMAIFDAFRLILALLHIFYLILIGLRILKWGETSL